MISVDINQINTETTLDAIHEAFKSHGIVQINTVQQPREVRDVSNFLNKQTTTTTNSSTIEESLLEKVNAAVKSLVQDKFKTKTTSTGTWLLYYKLNRNESATVHHDIRTQSIVDGETILVAVAPALQSQSKSAYLCPKVQQSKASSTLKPVPQREPKSVPEQKQELTKLFHAMEGSLMYFQATSINGIKFEELQNRVKMYNKQNLSYEALRQIFVIFPDCYKLQAGNGSEKFTLLASNLPESAAKRKEIFASNLESTEFPIAINGTTAVPDILRPSGSASQKRKRTADKFESLKKKKSPDHAMNSNTVKQTNPCGMSLLDRIKAKEQARNANPLLATNLKQQRYQSFINAHLKRVCAILVTMQKKSYSMDHIIKIMGDSLQQKLSKRESADVIETIAKQAPDFCEIIDLNGGSVQALKISSGWTASRLSQRLSV